MLFNPHLCKLYFWVIINLGLQQNKGNLDWSVLNKKINQLQTDTCSSLIDLQYSLS